MCKDTQSIRPAPEPRLYLRSKTVVSRQVAGETLVVPIRGKVGDLAYIYSFNDTGSALWATLEHPRSLEDLTLLLHQEFEVTWDDAQRDANAFVQEIQAAGLLAEVAD